MAFSDFIGKLLGPSAEAPPGCSLHLSVQDPDTILQNEGPYKPEM